ncbi:Reverse transcriptase domain [Sesbania bispinosa]|nr:Reverse transcriptase domain [Sesbania bispinosa]
MDLFNRFVSDLGLMDLNLKGCKYTWVSNPRNGFITREKLDRVLVNWPWKDLFSNAMAIALPPNSSDHSPIIMWTNKKLSNVKNFKYEAMWDEEEECAEVVKNGWNGDTTDSPPTDKFLQKARNCKSVLTGWHKKTFKQTGLQLQQLNEELQFLLNQEKWGVEGQSAVENMVLSHFQMVYKSDGPVNFRGCEDAVKRKVTDTINEELMRPITEEEVKKATFSMGAMKAPGPGGLNGLFFQNHWEALKTDVMAVVTDFFITGNLNGELNETLVALVPKILQPERLQQYRPICCCNYIYKINSKIYVHKLKPHIDGLVSQNQSAFVGGRLIQDNLIIAQEVFHSLKKKNGPGKNSLAIKLDLFKAYDRLEWSFLHQILLAYGDAVLFAKAENNEILQVVRILNAFTNATGQRINLQKSGIIFGMGIPPDRRREISNILSTQEWNSPGRYLGLPAEWERGLLSNNWAVRPPPELRTLLDMDFQAWRDHNFRSP